jgi:hypothetical protein
VSCLPPEAYTPLRPSLACIMLAERANFVTIPLVHDDVTVGAKIFILCNPWPADRQKPHGCVLCYAPLSCAAAELIRASAL